MRSYWITGVVLALAGAACAGSQGEQVRDARMEQAEARSEARQETAEHNEAVREDAIEQSADRARATTGGPAASANKELVNVSEERAQFQSQAQEQLDKLGAQIGEAQEKLTALGGRAPLALQSELATTTRQYQSLQRDVRDLNQTPADNWESTTDQIDNRLTSLDKRVAELKDDIDDVS